MYVREQTNTRQNKNIDFRHAALVRRRAMHDSLAHVHRIGFHVWYGALALLAIADDGLAWTIHANVFDFFLHTQQSYF